MCFIDKRPCAPTGVPCVGTFPRLLYCTRLYEGPAIARCRWLLCHAILQRLILCFVCPFAALLDRAWLSNDATTARCLSALFSLPRFKCKSTIN